ncbi:MAG TPA: GMC oxidoreductase [Blastocatellia bacterium]|nr:GMC oxidoreductase [Blastocatellia bacterium]
MNYDAIVIGTGFGATIAATRLVERGKRVVVLERGTWWVTPDAPGQMTATKNLYGWIRENNHPVQHFLNSDDKDALLSLYGMVRSRRNKVGLYNFSHFKQALVLTASGVGGGSLIYSNVNSVPRQEVLEKIGLEVGPTEFEAARRWMQGYRGRFNRIVTKMPLPGRDITDLGEDSYLYLGRTRALKEAAAAVSKRLGIEADWHPLDLSTVEYDPERGSESEAAEAHTFCERLGRCVLGCPRSATHALSKTLYARLLARPELGATVWPLANVRYATAVEGGYKVSFEDYGDGGKWKSVFAPMVFFGAGTLGTTEILLRSRDRGDLRLSDKLGQRFSTNGNFSGFAAGTSAPVHSTEGPINTCGVRLNLDGFNVTVEDCGIPPTFAGLLSTFVHAANGSDVRRTFRGKIALTWTRDRLPDFKKLSGHSNGDSARADVANTFYFNVSSEDDASGVFRLHNNGLDLDWPTPIASHPVFEKIETLLRDFADAMGGRYVPFPTWRGVMDRKLVVLHPLGGCAVGATNAEGVVDGYGRLFDGGKPKGSTDVLPGLYVVDGSAIPGAVATNPAMTIAAHALKTVAAALP